MNDQQKPSTPAETTPSSAPESHLMRTLIIVVITAIVTVWVTTTYIFPREFKPVELSQKEQATLDQKLKALHFDLNTGPPKKSDKADKTSTQTLEPEKYTEVGAKRDVEFSEREVNALIAHNTDLANKMAIDLSDDLISIRILMPMDPDMPLVGGKVLKISAGADLHYANGKPVVIIKGVSFWGVPVPNAWLGNLKNVDLVHEFGNKGFWKAFAAGVDNISVTDGKISLRLKE